MSSDIRSWWEVPSIAHFCSLFRTAFGLTDFEIEDLEEALLSDETVDGEAFTLNNTFLGDLHARLLRGLFETNDIHADNFEPFLSQVLKIRWEDELKKENPLKDNLYSNLSVKQKVEILHNLCDFRLDVADVQDLLKGLDADSLRVEPLGRDSEGSIYWYFYGTRLYKETPAETAEEKQKKKLKERKKLAAKKKKRKKKRVKGKRKQKKKASSDSESDFITSSSSEDFISEEEEEDLDSGSEEDKSSSPNWSVVCSTAVQWEELAESFKKSKNRDERLLYQTLSEDFVPEIEKMIEAKEKAYQKKLLELAPRRASTRIAIKMSLREDDSEFREQDDEERSHERERLAEEKRVEEEEKQKEKDKLAERRQQERAERARLREERQWMRMNGEFPLDSAMPENGDESDRQEDDEPKPKKERVPEFDGDDDRDEDLYTGMYKVLDYLKKHNNAWPFLEPVDESYAPQYTEIIETPMDLSTIEEKLDKGAYKKLDHFQDDMQLMFDNCDEYNGQDSMYTKMANTLKAAFERQIKKHFPEDDDNSDEDYEEELNKGRRKERERERKGRRRSEFSVNDFIMNRQESQPTNPGMGPGSMQFPFMNEMGMNRVPNPMMATRHPQDFQFPPGVPPGFAPDGRPVYPPQFYQNYYSATMARFNMPQQQQQFNPYTYQPPSLTRAPMADPQGMAFPQQSMDTRMPFQRPSPNGITPPGLSRMQVPPRFGLPPGTAAGPGSMPTRPQMPAASQMMPEASQQPPSSQASSPPTQGQPATSQSSGQQPQFPNQFRAAAAGLPNRPGGFPIQMTPNHPGSVPNQFPGFAGMNGPPRLQRAQMEQMAQHRMGPYAQNMPPGFGLGPRSQLPPGFMPSSQVPPKSQAAPTASVPSSVGASSSTLTSPAASDTSGDEKKATEKDAVLSPVPRTTPVSTSGEPTPPSLTAEKEKRGSEQAVPMSRPQSFGQPFPQQPYYGRPMAPYPQGLPQGLSSVPQDRQTSVITGPRGPAPSNESKPAEKVQPIAGPPKDLGTQPVQPKQEGPTNLLISRPQGTPTPPIIVPRDQIDQASKNKGVGMSISHILGSPARDTSSPRQSEHRAPVITVSRRSPPPLVPDRKRPADNKTKSDSNRSSPLVEGPTQPSQEHPPPGYKSWPPEQGPNVQGPPKQGSPNLGGGRPRGFLEDLFNGKPPPAKEVEMAAGESSAPQGPQRLPFTSLLKEIAPQRESPGKDGPFMNIDSKSSDPQAVSRSLGGMNQAHKDFMTRNYLRGQTEGQRFGPLTKQMGPFAMYPGKMGPEGMSPLAFRSQGQDMANIERERAMQQLAAAKRTPEGQFVDLDAMQYREQPGYPTPEHLFLIEQRRQQERMAASRGSVIGGDSMHMMRYPANILRQQQEQQYIQAMYGNRMRNGEFTSSEEAPSSKIPRFS